MPRSSQAFSGGNRRWISDSEERRRAWPGRPEVLAIGARNGRMLISHDPETMPAHFSRFILNSTSSGLLIVAQRLDTRMTIEQLLTVWAASEAEEWIDRVGYIPF